MKLMKMKFFLIIILGLFICKENLWAIKCLEKEKTVVQKPFPLGIFLANHAQSLGIDKWNLERWKIEIQNLKKMGATTIWFLPIQFGQHSENEFVSGSAFWELQKDICKAIVDAGLEVGIYIGYNDVFPETLERHPDWNATYGKYGMEQAHACPSVPEAQMEITELRRKVFRDLCRIDYIISPITDYGGCSCDKCAPLPKTYIKSLKEMVEVCREFHPKVKVIAAGHAINMHEEDMLRDLVRKADWINYVADVPRGAKPIIKYYMCPEITMVDGWGAWGPKPALKEIKEGYLEDECYTAGSVTYSEGIYDDVNRFAVLQFAKNPHRSILDVATQYAKEWLNLNYKDARRIGKVIVGLGTRIPANSQFLSYKEGVNNPQADKRLKELIEVREDNPMLRDNYRYWLLLYRAVYESFSTVEGELPLEVLNAEIEMARKELMRLDSYYGNCINGLNRWSKPELSPFSWPRSFNYMWRRENKFIKHIKMYVNSEYTSEINFTAGKIFDL